MATMSFNHRDALFLAAVCRQTYVQFDNKDGTFILPRNYEVAGTFQAKLFGKFKEIFGFILEADDNIVIAFRGTSSPFDWMADMIARQQKYPFVRNAGWTHEGFTAIYRSARKQIFTILNRLPEHKKLYITGHSLGGALATLCAIDVAVHSHYPSPFVYTFGAPRTGDPAFAKAYHVIVRESHRVYNLYDIVTQVPTVLYKSPRTGALYRYLHVRNGYKLTFQHGNVSSNHTLSGYFAALSALDPDYARQLRELPGFCP
jgi:triacylglycerol lipase